MKHAACLIACVGALAACNKSPEVNAKNASVAEVAQKVRDAVPPSRPARLWQSKVTIDQLDIPGMPAGMAQRMKSMMAEKQEHGFQTCLTAEDVKRPKEDFFAGRNKECRYDHFTMGGGKIDATMRCGGKTRRQRHADGRHLLARQLSDANVDEDAGRSRRAGWNVDENADRRAAGRRMHGQERVI